MKVAIFLFEDDGAKICYSPALDLSGYGKTDQEALDSFEIALEEFMKYTVNKKTIKSVLINLGWNIERINRRSKTGPNLIIGAPQLHTMLAKDEYLSEIFDNKEFEKRNKDIRIPAFA